MPMVTFDIRYSVGMVDGAPSANAVLELRLPTDGEGGIRAEFIYQEVVLFSEPLHSTWGIFLSGAPACRARKMQLCAPSWEELSERIERSKGRTIDYLEAVVSLNVLAAAQPPDSTIVVGIGEGPEVEAVEDLPMTVQEEREQHFVMQEFGLDTLPCSDAAGWVMENLNAIKGPYQATWDKMGAYERFKIAAQYLKEHEPNWSQGEWYEWAEEHGPLPF